jgi:hypothetical protein
MLSNNNQQVCVITTYTVRSLQYLYFSARVNSIIIKRRVNVLMRSRFKVLPLQVQRERDAGPDDGRMRN